MRFHATVQLNGKTSAGLAVPPGVVEALGPGRPAVDVTINGYRYRGTVEDMGGEHLLPVSAEVREAAGVVPGDVVVVEIELDPHPRELEVPADLRAALAADATAEAYFDGLPYGDRRRHVLSIEDATTPETRRRRIDRAVAMFREGRS